MFSDRFGRLPVIRIALLGGVICGIGLAFTPTLAILTVARGLTGAFFGGIIPASITYVGDTTGPKDRQSAMSDLMAAVALGTATATATAGILGQLASWRIVFALAAVLGLVSLLSLWRLQEPERDNATGVLAALRLIFRHKWALLVVGLAFVEGGLVLGILTLLAPALESQGVATSLAGLAVAAYGVGAWLFSRLVGPVTRRISAPRVLAVGGIFLAAGLGVVALSLSVSTVIIAAILLGGA